LRVLVVYAHPVESSFNAAVFAAAVETLKARGHEVDACDLYAEEFPAIMSREDRLLYHDTTRNRTLAGPWMERLRAAEAVVLVFPAWLYGPPAMLKGWLDKVLAPGVAFELVDGRFVGSLSNVRRVAGFVTYGGSWFRALLAGDPPRKLFTRTLRAYVGPAARIEHVGKYAMDVATQAQLHAHLQKVRATLDRW
jgi:NAD(P)H dehydrogenase (quinone)